MTDPRYNGPLGPHDYTDWKANQDRIDRERLAVRYVLVAIGLALFVAFWVWYYHRIAILEARVTTLESDRLHLLTLHERELRVLQGQGEVLLTLGMDYQARQGLGIKKGPPFPVAQVDEDVRGTKRLTSPPPSSVSPR